MKSQLSVVGIVLLASLSFQEVRRVSRVGELTPEQKEILSHLELVYLDDGQGGTAKTLRVSGLNVQIVNGLGATNGNPAQPNSTDPAETATNGLGNLILGYAEEPFFASDRTGSHNLVIGSENRYSSYGGLVAGRLNSISGPYATIVGGLGNIATADSSAILGGNNNRTTGRYATVSGGASNFATGQSASISGGSANNAGGDFAAVSGGFQNFAQATHASASGGSFNLASGELSSVTGGELNVAVGEASSVSGGREVGALSDHSWAAGTLLEE